MIAKTRAAAAATMPPQDAMLLIDAAMSLREHADRHIGAWARAVALPAVIAHGDRWGFGRPMLSVEHAADMRGLDLEAAMLTKEAQRAWSRSW